MKKLNLLYPLLFFLLLFGSKKSFGQIFFDSLQMEADSTYNSSFNFIDVDSLNKVFFGSNNVRMTIDSTATYQVLFSDGIYWEHQNGMEGPWTYEQHKSEESIKYFVDSTLSRPRNVKKNYHSSKTYTGIELIKKTDVCISNCVSIATSFKDTIFSAFPFIYERNDWYNRKWTAFSNDQYLVFRYVHSYPYGNQKSWYKEYLIYLKRRD